MMAAAGVMVGSGLASEGGGDERVSIFGTEFVVVDDPGNRDTNEFEVPLGPEERIGGVDYVYLIAVTEVTVAQHLEFVEAYYPFYVIRTGSELGSAQFSGRAIRVAFGQIHILPGHHPDEPTVMSWEYAARYINWLHNGKIIEDWAFETGVYDTSTFVQDNDGNWLHQESHSPGARFWMPTADEWIKAAYWDPQKNNGAGGYWRYQNGSDIEPRPGLPSEGGERNAGVDNNDGFPLPVGSYPTVMSPWGVLDMAGGQSELFETIPDSGNRYRRGTGGSDFNYWHYDDIFSPDIIGYYVNTSAFVPNGLRLASTAYAPADLNEDGRVDFFDVAQFVRWFLDDDERADFREDQLLNRDDVRVFLGLSLNI
ncbi:MAG: SUMF1/EgtB/PvdO family nonheme iron enzyme [Phycisphaerales bacterium]|nr:SUMF1/EgtB/PvdO family nonheme iron enzyme [Phycisphaerales bacterium]